MAQVKKHKGIRNYSGDEVSNLAIGQAGFDMISNTTMTPTSTDAGGEFDHWIALKNVSGGTVLLKAMKPAWVPGDNLTQTGETGGGTLTIEDGDTIYGVFVSVTVPTSKFVIAYRG
tara:strand:+ start:9595 stop:9942 length:348 start_codon:yes stop_codon:yes gene_type:complete